MEKINETPFVMEALPLMGPNDKPILTIIVKGSFDMVNGQRAILAEKQLPLCFGDEYPEDAMGGSVKFESDIAPFKPRTDIALTGRAHAPGGVPVRSVSVSLSVGGVKKSLKVFGDRHWVCLNKMLPVVMSETQPFTTMDLIYEKAFGGIDQGGGGYCEQNPIGVGFFGKKKRGSIHMASLPNIEDPKNPIRRWNDHPAPAGFGFYGKGWAPRSKLIGSYDDEWKKERAPLPPIDHSFLFYNAAHPDLQLEGYLKGDEQVKLENLSPEGELEFSLPGLYPLCKATKDFSRIQPPVALTGEAGSGAIEARELVQDIPLNLDTLCLIPEEKKLYCVWRGMCPVLDLTALEVKNVSIRLLT